MKKRSPLSRILALSAVAAVSLLLFTACGGGGGSSSTSPAPFTPPPSATATLKTTTTVPADGSLYFSDDPDVGLVAPAGATVDSAAVLVTSSTLSGGPMAEMAKKYNFLTDFFQVAAEGENDTLGPVELVFKTTDPDARILAVSDRYFNGLLEPVADVNGEIRLTLNAGPSNLAAMPDASFVNVNSDVRFALVKPKVALARESARVAFAEPEPRDCSLFGNCRTRNGTVQVYWHNGLGITTADADATVKFFEDALTGYKNMGLAGATINLNWDYPLIVKVSSKEGTPQYGCISGAISLTASDVTGVAGNSVEAKGTILHELAHYVQDKTYAMIPAALSGYKTWWIETTADNMVFQQVPEMVDANATSYGQVENAMGDRFGVQFGPFQWSMEEGGYFHAQLLRLNICDNDLVCPLSLTTFASNLNAGAYPLADTDKQNQLYNNIHEFSRYMLGLDPLAAGMASPPDSIRDGFTVGDFVTGQTKNNAIAYDVNGYANRVKKVGETVEITATVEKGGLYVLEVNNDGVKSTGNPTDQSIPLSLTVNAGTAPVRYRENASTDTTYKTGITKLVIQPISKNFGTLEKVRLAALGLDDGTSTFNAKVEPVDLSGDWVIDSTTLISHALVSSNPEKVTASGEEVPDSVKGLSVTLAENGVMNKGATSMAYAWAGPAMPAGFEISSDVTLKSAAIEWKLDEKVDMSGAGAKSSIFKVGKQAGNKPAGLPLGLAVAALPLAALFLPGRNRTFTHLMLVLALSGLGLVVTSCAIPGLQTADLKTTITFDKLKYIGSAEDDTLPRWELTGTAASTVQSVIQVPILDDQGNEIGSEDVTVSGPVTFSVVAKIYKDGVIVDSE